MSCMLERIQSKTKLLSLSIALLMMVLSFSSVAHNNVVVIPLFGDEPTAVIEPVGENYMFVTNAIFTDLSFGDAVGADAICQQELML